MRPVPGLKFLDIIPCMKPERKRAFFDKPIRYLKAQVRDLLVLWRETRFSLILFVLILFFGTIAIYTAYPDPEMTPLKAFYASFTMIFFEHVLAFPQHWFLQMLFIIIPILGLAAIADGLLHIGIALVNKRARGQKWQVAMASIYRQHIIVCGFGKVGYRVSQELRKFKRDVVAVEMNPGGRFIEKAQQMDIPLILADATRKDTLKKASVTHADAIIPCTDDELTNLKIALEAREQNPQIKVVMRMFDPDFAEKVEKGFGIHTAFSTSALTAPIFATAAMRINVKYSFYLNDVLFNVCEMTVQPEAVFAGWTIQEMEGSYDLSVLYSRDDNLEIIHPEPTHRIQPGIQLLVLATLETLRDVQGDNPLPHKGRQAP